MTESKEEIKKHIIICIDKDNFYKAINPEIFETIKKEESVSCENGHTITIKIGRASCRERVYDLV